MKHVMQTYSKHRMKKFETPDEKIFRISLVKQSTVANSLKCKSKKGWGGSTSSSEAEGPDDEISPSNDATEFVSDTFQGDGSADADVRKGMKALGVKRGDSKTSTGSSAADGKLTSVSPSVTFSLSLLLFSLLLFSLVLFCFHLFCKRPSLY